MPIARTFSVVAVLASTVGSCWAQGTSPRPGAYWKCPVAERPGERAPGGIGGRVEVRFSATQDDVDQPTWLIRDDRDAYDDYNTRRIRLSYRGQSRDDLAYFVQVRRDWGADEIEFHDAYLTWSAWDYANVTLGQMMTPVDRQFLTSDIRLPMAERPRASTVLVPDRDIGLLLHDSGCTGRFGWYAGVFTGDGKNELSTGGTFMPAARIEWLARPDLNVGLSWARNHDPMRSNYQKFLKKNGDPYELLDLYSSEKLDEETWGVDLLLRREAAAVWAGYMTKDLSGACPCGFEAEACYVHCSHYVPWHGRSDRLELVAGYEEFDPNTSVVDQLDADWSTLGFNYHLDGCKRQVRVEYIIRDEKRDEVDNDTFLVQYDHVFP